MTSAVIEDNHRVSIPIAAVKDLAAARFEQVSSCPTSVDLVKHIHYETFASILLQCENSDISRTSCQQFSANQGKLGQGKGGGRENGERLCRMK